ncbi:MAG: nucleotide-binding protein [Candidatus Eutrophobiaceae bacterium]
MRTITILNPKGGCGKTSLVVNIAGYFASKELKTAIADTDPQGSCSVWLANRPAKAIPIASAEISAKKIKTPRNTDVLVIDTPAGIRDANLIPLLRKTDFIVIPVLPSPFDVAATQDFLHHLVKLNSALEKGKNVHVATVANRVREDTLAAASLEVFLRKLRLPNGKRLRFITLLRQSQNYIRSIERGLSLFEFAPSSTCYDREQWVPLLNWLNK